jgi:hypothetical protein
MEAFDFWDNKNKALFSTMVFKLELYQDKDLTPLVRRSLSSSRNSSPVWNGGGSGKRTIKPGKSQPPNCWLTTATSAAKTPTPRRTSHICRLNKS